MSVRTKTHHTRKICRNKHSAEKSINWREFYKKELKEYGEAGLALRGCRHKDEITQQELADSIGVRQHHISEMESGKRPIGKVMAKKLAAIFNVNYKVFL